MRSIQFRNILEFGLILLTGLSLPFSGLASSAAHVTEAQGLQCSTSQVTDLTGLALEMCAPPRSVIRESFNVTLTLTNSGPVGVRLPPFIFLVNLTGKSWDTTTFAFAPFCSELSCGIFPGESLNATATVTTLTMFAIIVPGTGEGVFVSSAPAPPGDYILEAFLITCSGQFVCTERIAKTGLTMTLAAPGIL